MEEELVEMVTVQATTIKMVYGEEERELAFQVWAYQASRNVVHTARLLLEQHELDIPRRTIQDWVEKGQWAIKRADSLRQLAPDLDQHVSLEIKLGSVDGVHLLRKVVQGDRDTIDLYGRQLAPAVKAALGLVEMGGWHTKGDTRLHLDTPKDTRTIDLTNATDEELRELELTMLE